MDNLIDHPEVAAAFGEVYRTMYKYESKILEVTREWLAERDARNVITNVEEAGWQRAKDAVLMRYVNNWRPTGAHDNMRWGKMIYNDHGASSVIEPMTDAEKEVIQIFNMKSGFGKGE